MKKYIVLISLLSAQLALSQAPVTGKIKSNVEVMDVRSGKRQVILTAGFLLESPNWSRDGKYFIINSKGLLEKISLKGESLGVVDTEFANRCNNAHGISYDGKSIFFSYNDVRAGINNNSRIFKVPIEGGTPLLLTEKAPSFWHSVSRSGKNILYSAQRNGEWDIYKLPTAGGDEIRLTSTTGLDEGPEYGHDSKFIYFNSNRTGRMQIFRMKPDGTDQERLTDDEFDNWFAHPSPDGKWLVYMSYLEDQKGKHPIGKEVKLRLLNLKTKQVKDLTETFVGGQGTLNVPCWSPDGKKIIFVTYKVE
ncbi:transporter [Runella sp. CRIBMP]|uniref:TolB family protein n=1 Tax=Runella sp. CRIBMP TaxID=2683261 RepID=UPI0014124740|nr:PD40 domain-containing protein [Runella sp. CRIBMP]NBB17977.1 transporter [Runella sp. CRIBMP]